MPELGEKRSLWKRYLIGTLLVVVATAAASAVTLLNEVDRIAKAFHGNLHLGADLAPAPPGKPQTILLIGSDQRAKTARDANAGARSDTMILMRLDPSKNAIAMLSLPRDLKVHIPGHGIDKLNAAYSEGGPRLTLKTVKELTGLTVNHVINIDFRGFKEAVDAIHCVYADIDRRYFNNNANPGDQYATINIQPGYQRLCGQDALDYVRYRHTDSDIVRAARQQDFLRQAKAQVGARRLFGQQDKLVKIVAKYTRSDIKGRSQVLSLIKLAIGSVGSPVREIHFPAQIGPSYVTASQSAVRKVVRQFLGENQPGGGGGGGSSGGKHKHHSHSSAPSDLIDISAAGKQQALNVAQHERGMLVYYPSQGVKGSSFSFASPRTYKICGPHNGRCWTSYRMVIARDLIGEYYGLQGTKWMDPPILRSPDAIKKIGHRKFELFFDGHRLRLVAWREKDAVYWISNTLLQSISKRDLLDIARAAKPL